MKVSLFNLMPHPPLGELPTRWPTPHALCDPAQAVRQLDAYLDQFALADELGFDWVACAEHHFSANSLSPNPSIVAGALSQRVRRARIAILGSLLPINNPVRVAEELAMVDVFTGGRLIAGLLRGAPYEYAVYNVNPAESRGRYEEAWDLILRAWTEPGPFGWDGPHYQFRTVSIWPRPVQQPHPPIFVAGSSRESAEFAARKRVGVGLAFTNIPLATDAARYYRDTAAAAGWEPTPEQIVYQAPIYVAESDAQAEAEITPHLAYTTALMAPTLRVTRLAAGAGFFGARDAQINARFQTGVAREQQHALAERIALGQLFCGSPDSVVAQLQRLRAEVGAGVVNLIFQIGSLPPAATTGSIELFAREVLPRIRAL
jgi:alkanesulfonate monooxygenase SsuD/methylene tetrahydromethanopterin reductase-like flavin-dependent oxidoreductase (luciferase family)